MSSQWLTKLCQFDQRLKRIILIPLCLKSETSAHAQIVITCYYKLFTNFLAWYEGETYTGDKWSCSLILSTWSRNFFQKLVLVCKLYIVHLSNLFCSNFNFIACMEVDISTKNKHTRKYFQEKSRENFHDVNYRPHLSIFLIMIFLIMIFHELHMCSCFKF